MGASYGGTGRLCPRSGRVRVEVDGALERGWCEGLGDLVNGRPICPLNGARIPVFCHLARAWGIFLLMRTRCQIS